MWKAATLWGSRRVRYLEFSENTYDKKKKPRQHIARPKLIGESSGHDVEIGIAVFSTSVI